MVQDSYNMSSIWLLLLPWISSMNYVSCIEEALFRRVDGVYFSDYVMKTESTSNELECCSYCLQDESCVSVNYKSKGDDHGFCELNNATLTNFPESGLKNSAFSYMENTEVQSNKNNVLPSKRSCKELLETNATLQNGKYYLYDNRSDEQYPVYCQMSGNIPGCNGRGWTLVMKIDGGKTTFGFDSPYWTNKESYAVKDGLEGLPEKESKLASYWNTPFKKICLGMTVNDDRRWMMLDYEATSLYSVIASKRYQRTFAGRETWKSLIAGSSLQQNCNKEGFSIIFGQIRMRLGYMANNQDYCSQSDSCIGFGISYKACYMTSDITCGNLAQCSNNDNGLKLTSAFGYILVQ